MYYFIATKKGIGAELWGTYDDLRTLYEVLGKFWNQDGFTEKAGFDSRDKVISSFIYEIRKTYEGRRLKREYSHFMPDLVPHFGCQLSWVHIIFSMNAIRLNCASLRATNLILELCSRWNTGWKKQCAISIHRAPQRSLHAFLEALSRQTHTFTNSCAVSIQTSLNSMAGRPHSEN